MTEKCIHGGKCFCPEDSWICPLAHRAFRGRVDVYYLERKENDELAEDAIGVQHGINKGDNRYFQRALTYFLFDLKDDLSSWIDDLHDFYNKGIVTAALCAELHKAFNKYLAINSDNKDRYGDIFDYLREIEK